jgi:hypothetical protein
MNEIDLLYLRLLHFGLPVARDAAAAGDSVWAHAELEMLHNIPSLIGETNALRHRYYWESERAAYIDWVSQAGRERATSQLNVFYKPVWRLMAPFIQQLLPTREAE